MPLPQLLSPETAQEILERRKKVSPVKAKKKNVIMSELLYTYAVPNYFKPDEDKKSIPTYKRLLLVPIAVYFISKSLVDSVEERASDFFEPAIDRLKLDNDSYDFAFYPKENEVLIGSKQPLKKGADKFNKSPLRYVEKMGDSAVSGVKFLGEELGFLGEGPDEKGSHYDFLYDPQENSTITTRKIFEAQSVHFNTTPLQFSGKSKVSIEEDPASICDSTLFKTLSI